MRLNHVVVDYGGFDGMLTHLTTVQSLSDRRGHWHICTFLMNAAKWKRKLNSLGKHYG